MLVIAYNFPSNYVEPMQSFYSTENGGVYCVLKLQSISELGRVESGARGHASARGYRVDPRDVYC